MMSEKYMMNLQFRLDFTSLFKVAPDIRNMEKFNSKPLSLIKKKQNKLKHSQRMAYHIIQITIMSFGLAFNVDGKLNQQKQHETYSQFLSQELHLSKAQLFEKDSPSFLDCTSLNRFDWFLREKN